MICADPEDMERAVCNLTAASHERHGLSTDNVCTAGWSAPRGKPFLFPVPLSERCRILSGRGAKTRRGDESIPSVSRRRQGVEDSAPVVECPGRQNDRLASD